MYFVEDLLGPEHLDWYPEVRKVCATPQAVGEVFSNPAEYYPLIASHVIDFIRTRVPQSAESRRRRRSRPCARSSA